ncbi:virulence factor [Streptococcus dentasini]
MPTLSLKRQRQLKEDGYDLDFLWQVQPQGGIIFLADDYWKSGDGYHTCLHFYMFPSEGLERFWLQDLTQLKDTQSFVSILHRDSDEVKKELEKSIEEKMTRISEKNKTTTNMKEIDEVADLRQMFREIDKQNIGVLAFYVRVYVSAWTEKDLFKKVDEIKDKTSAYKSTILLGEQELEFQAPFIPTSKQILLPNSRQPQTVRAHDLAGGYFFNHTKLEDERGSFYGLTRTEGVVNFNFLTRDDKRTRSFMIISGNPRMGQTTFLLRHTDDMYHRGNFIRNIDASGAFKELTRKQQGKILDLSGGENRINIFQVFPQATEENGLDVDEEESYNLHINKLKNILKLMNEDVTNDDLATFQEILNEFYIDENIWVQNPSLHKNSLRATKLERDEYPVLSDFIPYLEDYERSLKAQINVDEVELASTKRIKKTFKLMLSSYGAIFEGTTEFEDISQEQVVTFDFSKLKSDDNLFNAQVFNVLSIISADVVNNGKRCKQAMRDDPQLQEEDMPHYIVNISDAQTLLDPRFEMSVETLANVIGYMGDNFAGVVLSVNSLQGIIFESGGGIERDPYVIAVRRIFGMMQYRVMAQTDETTVPLLANALAGSMTESELESLPELDRGELFLNIAGVGNIVFTQSYLDYDQYRYGQMY